MRLVIVSSLARAARCICQNRKRIAGMAYQDFRKKYLGSYAGLVWAFAQPLCTVFVYWFVFSVGLKTGQVNGVDFFVWMICGLTPWFFINESLGASTVVVREYSFLVKNMSVDFIFLPLVKVASATITHIFFVLLTCFVAKYNGIDMSISMIQVVYYTLCTQLLCIGLSWVTSSVNVFVNDVEHAVGVILQFLFWMTPVVWPVQSLPSAYQWVVKLNPFYYIVSGYRDAILFGQWFWARPVETAYFWGVTLCVLAIGATVFSKLRPHFADVL